MSSKSSAHPSRSFTFSFHSSHAEERRSSWTLDSLTCNFMLPLGQTTASCMSHSIHYLRNSISCWPRSLRGEMILLLCIRTAAGASSVVGASNLDSGKARLGPRSTYPGLTRSSIGLPLMDPVCPPPLAPPSSKINSARPPRSRCSIVALYLELRAIPNFGKAFQGRKDLRAAVLNMNNPGGE